MAAQGKPDLREVVGGDAVAAREPVGVLNPKLGAVLDGSVLRARQAVASVALERGRRLVVELVHDIAPLGLGRGAAVGELRRDRAVRVGG